MAKGIPAWAQAVTETLFNVVQKPPGNSVAPRRIADQLGQWMGHLSRNAALHWTPTLVSGQVCAFCDENALGVCISCGDYCCLGHSHVSHRAELLCDECVARLVDGQGPSQSPERSAFEFFHLTPQATWGEVSAVYRTRARSAHPDAGGTQAEMVEVGRQYDVLKLYYERRAA